VGQPWAVARAKRIAVISQQNKAKSSTAAKPANYWSSKSSTRREDPEEALDEDTRRRIMTI